MYSPPFVAHLDLHRNPLTCDGDLACEATSSSKHNLVTSTVTITTSQVLLIRRQNGYVRGLEFVWMKAWYYRPTP